jgi:DUF1365 family protein
VVTVSTPLRVTPPALPSLVVGTVSHTRHAPFGYGLRHRHYQWLVDVDDLPRHPWPLGMVTRVDPRAHLDGGQQDDRHGTGIRGDLARLLERGGRELAADTRVVLLTHATVLGHVFDPLSVYWCLAPDGALRACVLEVHNTYGGRHAYVVDLDARGRTQVDKAFLVSPFNDVSGTYIARVFLDPGRLAVSIRLVRSGATILTAAVTGTPIMATPRTILAVAARHLLMTYRVSVLIRWHGVRLWLRRRRLCSS